MYVLYSQSIVRKMIGRKFSLLYTTLVFTWKFSNGHNMAKTFELRESKDILRGIISGFH